jgi:hypothetical protein
MRYSFSLDSRQHAFSFNLKGFIGICSIVSFVLLEVYLVVVFAFVEDIQKNLFCDFASDITEDETVSQIVSKSRIFCHQKWCNAIPTAIL